MSRWNDSRLVDLMSLMDVSLLEEDYPETDMEIRTSVERIKQSWTKKKIAAVSGVAAAGSIVLTGAVVFFCRRHHAMHQMA
jgi:hypothetical protein